MQVALRKMWVALAFCSVLLACGPEADQVATSGNPPEPANTSGLQERLPDTCELARYQGFVGQPLAETALPAGISSRIVRPGMILTQEYVSSRVNFHVNEAGMVTKVICG